MKEEYSTIKKFIKEWAIVVIITALLSFLILQVIQVARVHGASMEPTYQEGDCLIVDKVFYKQGKPDYNDIVVIDYIDSNHDSTWIIKRVIGLGGDHIEIKDNQLYRNGTLVKEDYLNDDVKMEDFSIDVLDNKIFVLGDNRNISLDSRELGYFDFDEDVIGKVIFKLF